ncbi:MAG: tetratricopeptide repeat protein [Chloroflexota bacterium]
MMKTVECFNCGAGISRHERACPYCGASNRDYQTSIGEVNALLEKALSAFQRGRYAAAIDSCSQVISLDPGVFNAYFYLASSLASLERYKEAIQAMKKAQALQPGNAAIHLNLGVLYKKEGEKTEARKYLEKALKLADADKHINNRAQVKQNIKKELRSLKRWGLF